jgi:hypothetical protein
VKSKSKNHQWSQTGSNFEKEFAGRAGTRWAGSVCTLQQGAFHYSNFGLNDIKKDARADGANMHRFGIIREPVFRNFQ